MRGVSHISWKKLTPLVYMEQPKTGGDFWLYSYTQNNFHQRIFKKIAIRTILSPPARSSCIARTFLFGHSQNANYKYETYRYNNSTDWAHLVRWLSACSIRPCQMFKKKKRKKLASRSQMKNHNYNTNIIYTIAFLSYIEVVYWPPPFWGGKKNVMWKGLLKNKLQL